MESCGTLGVRLAEGGKMPPHRDTEGTQFIYITTTGRVSGEPREIEIWFVEDEGRYYALSYIRERAQWVRNVRRNPQVGVWLGGRSFAAQARVLEPRKDAKTYRRAQRLMREKYEWGAGLPVEFSPEA